MIPRFVIELFDLKENKKCSINPSDLDDNELIMSVAYMMNWGEEQVFAEACKQTDTYYNYNDYFKTVMNNKPVLPDQIRYELRQAFYNLN